MESGEGFYAAFTRAPDARTLAFLRACGLDAQDDCEYTVTLRDADGRIAASGSLDGRVIKYVACDERYRGEGLIARVVSLLVEEACARGRTGLFLFTAAEKARIFASLGFALLCACEGAALMERGGGIKRYTQALKAYARPGTAGAIVMKADPFTLGHRYLIEYAAARVEHLHVFALREDRACFPPDAREALIRAGTGDLKNVTVHAGSDYVISSATFPTYFIRQKDSRARVQAGLDATLFGQYLAPALGISVRFAGEEPLSPVTQEYNQAMLRVLPPLGVRVEIIPRAEGEGGVISASRVRALLARGETEAACRLVPPATRDYLLSAQARDVLARLRNTEG